jgi:hypothetical protein
MKDKDLRRALLPLKNFRSKKMRIVIVMVLLFGLMSFTSKDYEKRGDKYLKVFNYDRALREYLKAYRKNNNDPDVLYKISYCYLNGNQLKYKAVPYLEKLKVLRPGNEEILFDLAQAFFHWHKFGQALKYLDEYEKKVAMKRPSGVDKTALLRRYIENAKQYVNEPGTVDLINLGKNINTSRSELSPFVTSDETTLFYSSDKRFNSYGNIYFFNVCVSQMKEDGWGKYKMCGSSVNSGFDEIVAGINPSGDEVFVFHNRYGKNVIASAKYRGNYKFEKMSDFGYPVDMKGGEYGVCMTEGGDTIIYAAEAANGSTDLFYALKLPDGSWGVSRLLPGKINSRYDENFPVYMPDEKRIYFSSNNEKSMGGYDLFYSEFDQETKEWGEPVNLGYPVNDTYDNYSISWVRGKRIGYVSAVRPDGYGNRDIYKVVFVNEEASERIFRCSVRVETGTGTVMPWFTPEINVYDTLGLKAGTYALTGDSSRFIMALSPGEYYLKIEGDEILEFTDTISVPEKLYRPVPYDKMYILTPARKK